MNETAVLLILLAAGVHATWNLLAKTLPGGAETVWLFTMVATIVYAPIAGVTVAVTGYRPAGSDWLFLVGTGILQAVYFVVLRRGYAVGDLSVVYPLARGTGPLMAVALAVVLVGERPSLTTVFGAIAISAGTLLLALPARGAGDHRVAVGFGLATGAVIGCYSVWDGYAVGELGIPALVLAWAADAGRAFWLTPVATKRWTHLATVWRDHRLATVGVGILSTGSYALVLVAMSIAPISSIAPAREISIVVGTLLGITLLGEPGGPKRLGSAAIITAGVGLIAFG